MNEVTGDLWEFHTQNNYVVITTNGNVNSQGLAVMGKGIALQAAKRYPKIREKLGYWLKTFGNIVYIIPEFTIITFPTKHNWWEKSDLNLIETSCIQLVNKIESRINMIGKKVYLPRPGCENGKLDWETQVKPILSKYLNDDFVIVNRPI